MNHSDGETERTSDEGKRREPEGEIGKGIRTEGKELKIKRNSLTLDFSLILFNPVFFKVVHR